MKKIIVVGAGVSGLAAAVRLQKLGYDVTLYEKEGQPGGKMNQIKENGFTFGESRSDAAAVFCPRRTADLLK